MVSPGLPREGGVGQLRRVQWDRDGQGATRGVHDICGARWNRHTLPHECSAQRAGLWMRPPGIRNIRSAAGELCAVRLQEPSDDLHAQVTTRARARPRTIRLACWFACGEPSGSLMANHHRSNVLSEWRASRRLDHRESKDRAHQFRPHFTDRSSAGAPSRGFDSPVGSPAASHHHIECPERASGQPQAGRLRVEGRLDHRESKDRAHQFRSHSANLSFRTLPTLRDSRGPLAQKTVTDRPAEILFRSAFALAR